MKETNQNVEKSDERTVIKLTLSDLVSEMKKFKKLYPDSTVKGYIVRSRKGTVMSNIVKVTNIFDESMRVDNIRTAPIYSKQYFIVIEIINKNNMTIEKSYATSDNVTFYLRKEGRLKQLTDSYNSFILSKLTIN